MSAKTLPLDIARRIRAWRDQGGNAAMMFALVTPVLVGGAGLAVETSFDFVSQTRLQSAADAAAYAAALENMAGSSLQAVVAAAGHEAGANGWTGGSANITVNTPPTSGPNAGKTNAVEVRLTQATPRFFTALFNQTPLTLGARSVAISQTAADACILALNKTANQAVYVQGNTQVSLAGCDVMSNSVANDAVTVWGSATLTADCAESAGGVQNHGGMTLSGCPSAVTNAPRVADPFASLPVPAPGASRSVPNGNGNNPVVLQPGSYASGMSLKGNVILASGVYYVSGGDFSINANASVSSASGGVTIYLAPGSHVSMQGNADVNLSAQASGTYSGILFFGDRSDTGSNKFNGDATSSLTGDLYFPSQSVNYIGNFSGSGGCTQIVADTVSWSGSTTISVDCSSKGMSRIPARQAVKLVE